MRDLFDQAKQNAPAIIFVDEIDAVGRHRGAGLGGGHDEREQTLNQLLVEMDGFDPKTNVILIAATNRPDILDPALLRSRFDRQIGVDAPDLKGRQRILEVHSKGKPLARGVDLEVLARKTPGFTGADLANVLNEAALLTARSNAQLIDNRALDEAVDRVIAGPQRRTRVMKDKEKLITAYHEGGRARGGGDELHRPRDEDHDPAARPRAGLHDGAALEDKYSISRNELLDQLTYAMGGRVAEEIVFHDPLNGRVQRHREGHGDCAQDGHRVRHVGERRRREARPVAGRVFLGRDMGHQRDYSEEIAEKVDGEVRTLIEQAHDEAWQVLNDNRDILDKLAAELLENETLDHNQIAEIFKDVRKLPERRSGSRAIAAPCRTARRSPSRPTRCRSTRAPSTAAWTRARRRSRSRPRPARRARSRDPRRLADRPEEGVPWPVWTPGASSAPCTRSCSRSARTRRVRGSSARRSGWPRPTPNSSAGSRSIR